MTYFIIAAIGTKTNVETNKLEARWSDNYHDAEMYQQELKARPDVLFTVITEAIDETFIKRDGLDD